MTSQSFAKLLLSLEWGNPYLVKHTNQVNTYVKYNLSPLTCSLLY